MRITQSTARAVMIKITEGKQKNVHKLREEYAKYVRDCYTSRLPKDLLAMFKKHSDYFRMANSIAINGKGFNRENVSIHPQVISNSPESYYGGTLDLTSEEAETATGYKRAWEAAKKALETLQSELEATLYGLRTFAQIQQHIPEAVKFLPKSTSLELTVDIPKLREQINSKP